MLLTNKERDAVLYKLEMKILFIRYEIEELEDEDKIKELEVKIEIIENEKKIICGG
jgi:hypothetical protein